MSTGTITTGTPYSFSGVLSSGVRYFFSFLFQGSLLKLILFSVLFIILPMFGQMMLGFIPSYIKDSFLASTVANFPPGVNFFLGMMALDYGFPLMVGSMIARFMIRRLPFIG